MQPVFVGVAGTIGVVIATETMGEGDEDLEREGIGLDRGKDITAQQDPKVEKGGNTRGARYNVIMLAGVLFL